MPTKRCEICSRMRPIEDREVCCADCEERELDLLIATYAFIHCYDADYCPSRELIGAVPAVHGTKLNEMFIRSWILKNWLEKNDINSLRVPLPLYEELKGNGFNLSDLMRAKLIKQKEKKVKLEPPPERPTEPAENRPHIGMVFVEKLK